MSTYKPYERFPKVRLSKAEWDEAVALPEYSATMPTGVTPGKRWRRHDGAFDHDSNEPPVWLLCEYGPVIDGRCEINMSRPMIRIKAKTTRCVDVPVLDLNMLDWSETNLNYIPMLSVDDYHQFLIFKTDADAVAFKMACQ